MCKTINVACGISLFLIAAGTTAAAQLQHAKSAKDPIIFREDGEGFEDSVPLPEDAIKELLATPEAKWVADKLRGLGRRDLAGLFIAVRIDLSGPPNEDFLVLGRFPMSGGDCGWFWIVHSVRNHPRVILFAHTDSVELRRSSANGLKIIQTEWWSAAAYSITEIYRFDGVRYRLVRKVEKDESGNR